ncbi:glycosyltransferase [Pontiella sulfatireligans]|uniref:Glycosyltransferase subfamily 4-like N-terminal domain-containing protein n=1 Tax=Pontiella sulfatireligans TaxID=2750658 RepID=A0A6C2UEH4_9BACT|nr:glycosyltransferase [Pontiella sulfatireligans]VGO18273.1 hypothetical protein SCARR_00325 [Pontiella sulfatireligans]
MKFIITSLTSWDEIPRARHQVTEALVQAGHEVVFVEKNRVGRLRIETRKEKPGLTLVSPFFPLDYRFRFRIPVINEFYQTWLFRLMRKRFGDQLVLNFDFTAHLLERYFKSMVYYCNDEYIGNSKYPVWLINQYHGMVERWVAKQAKLCVATSNHLVEKLQQFNPSVHLIPLGGPDPDRINATRDFGKKAFIKIGLMGTIKADYVAPKVINRLLDEDDFNLTFIGRMESDFLSLIQKKDNLEAKGILIGEALYAEMATFDVAIAPYEVECINAGGTPNKLFQYLACSCPIVISNIPNVQNRKFPPGTVYIAADEEEFVGMIRKAYDEDCLEYAQARLQYAADNTWEKRIRQFLSLLEKQHLLSVADEPTPQRTLAKN